jgi:hypothetical protein
MLAPTAKQLPLLCFADVGDLDIPAIEFSSPKPDDFFIMARLAERLSNWP